MARDTIAEALAASDKASRRLALAVLAKSKGFYESACGEYCTGEHHEHCAMKEYRALRRQLSREDATS